MKSILAIATTVVGLGLLAPSARAALITGVTASTSTVTNIGNINNIVNGLGLPGNTPALTGNHGFSVSTNAWRANAATGTLTFNLNGSYNLAGFSFWNFGGTFTLSTFGIQGVTVQSSTDGTNFSNIAGAPTIFARTSNLTISPQQFSFSPVTASFVRFVVTSTYGSPQFGVSEVQFDGTLAPTATPEPATVLGLLAVGGGLLATKRRRS